MKTITIRNFGPIDDCSNEVIKVYPITVFCGLQGAGKSTVAKLISTFSWMEKALVRGDIKQTKRSITARMLKKHCSFHRLENYFRESSELHYESDAYIFHYENGKFSIDKKEKTKFLMPKIMYVPAERNFMTVVEHTDKLKELPESLFELISEYEKALKSCTKQSSLPIEDYSIQYDNSTKTTWLFHKNENKVKLTEASSGFQSLAPLILVTRYISDIINNKSKLLPSNISLEIQNRMDSRIKALLKDDKIDDVLRRSLIMQQSSLYQNDYFINIVEEPEQNLYPTSQKNILFELLSVYNSNRKNQLIMTTHSPYLIDYLTLSIKAKSIKTSSIENKNIINNLVPAKAQVRGKDVCIYQVDNGKVTRLNTFDDMPSDTNLLNTELNNTNEVFAKLLELE